MGFNSAFKGLRVCVCSLRYPARNEHAPYDMACPALQHFSTLYAHQVDRISYSRQLYNMQH